MAFNVRQKIYGFFCLALPLIHALSPVESPAASIKQVCSSTDPTDCYPQVFQPTHEFQSIREGQDIPQGLHVRMNIYTGEKEAKLNILTAEESDGTENIPEINVERSLTTVNQPEEQDEDRTIPRNRPIEPPKDNPAGKISPPSPDDDDAGKFQNSMISIKTEDHLFDQALDVMQELSHDIYYGVELARDASVVEKLICLTLKLGSNDELDTLNNREYKAAAILASALQNNPTAVEKIGAHIKVIRNPSCGKGEREKDNFVSIFQSNLPKENANTLKIKVRVINALLRESSIRDSFLQDKGMELLLAIFLQKGEEFNIVRKKIGETVLDNFLDESLGANLNIWPQNKRSSKSECETQESNLSDGCWEHHIEQFSATARSEKWPKELLLALKNQRPKENRKTEL